MGGAAAGIFPPLWQQKQVGIFGVNEAGMWLGTVLKGQQGTTFADCPIIGVNEIPEGAVVMCRLITRKLPARCVNG
jgi:hypothetical protein